MNSMRPAGYPAELWTQRAGFKGQGLTATPRVKGILDVAACCMLKDRDVPAGSADDAAEALADAYVDVSQNPCRKPWTNKHGVNHTLCTGSCLYSYQQDRLLFAEEYMYLQGWSRGICAKEEVQPRLKELAGLGISLPCLASLIWSLYLVREFPS